MTKVPVFWRKAGVVSAALLLCELGARIGLPGVDSSMLAIQLQQSSTVLLSLYDSLAGGALSRGAVLALGALPYLSAKIFLKLAQVTIPAVRDAAASPSGGAMIRRWTRGLTVGLALVQSYGFARFVLSLPGVVADPGPGFIAETMLLLTTGATLLMLLGERIAAPAAHDASGPDADARVPSLTTGARAAIRSSSPDHMSTSAARSLESSGLPSTPPLRRDATPRAGVDPVSRGS